jgi:hypothetical protein
VGRSVCSGVPILRRKAASVGVAWAFATDRTEACDDLRALSPLLGRVAEPLLGTRVAGARRSPRCRLTSSRTWPRSKPSASRSTRKDSRGSSPRPPRARAHCSLCVFLPDPTLPGASSLVVHPSASPSRRRRRRESGCRNATDGRESSPLVGRIRCISGANAANRWALARRRRRPRDDSQPLSPQGRNGRAAFACQACALSPNRWRAACRDTPKAIAIWFHERPCVLATSTASRNRASSVRISASCSCSSTPRRYASLMS